MANKNKAKGTGWETDVTDYLNESDLEAKRTGSADSGSSDIHFLGEWTAEAKHEARIDLPGYLKQLDAAVRRAGRLPYKAAVWIKNRRHSTGDCYVVMSGQSYRQLVVYVDALEQTLVTIQERIHG